jgi:hypothetical protein
MRGEMREMLGTARAKETQYKELLAEYEGASKAVQRSTFVHRIMEIIKNLKHQEADIRSIIADTREVQREINNSTQVCVCVCVCARALPADPAAGRDASVRQLYSLPLPPSLPQSLTSRVGGAGERLSRALGFETVPSYPQTS